MQYFKHIYDVYQLLNVNMSQCELLKIDNRAIFVKDHTGVKATSVLKDIQILHPLTEDNYIEQYNYPAYINAIKNNTTEYYQLPNVPFQWAFLTNNGMTYLDISLKTYNYTLKDYYKSIIPASQKYPASLDLHYDGTDLFLVVKGDLYNCMPDEYKGYNYNIVTAGFKKIKNEVEIDHQYIDKNIILFKVFMIIDYFHNNFQLQLEDRQQQDLNSAFLPVEDHPILLQHHFLIFLKLHQEFFQQQFL